MGLRKWSVIVAWRLARHAPVLHSELHRCAPIELTHRGAIQLLPWRGALRHRGHSRRLATLDLLVRYQHVAAPRSEIDANHITGTQPRKPATRRAFGRGVEDRRTIGGPRLTTVADRRQARDALFQQCIRWLHVHDFRGARPTERPGTSNHEDRALVDAERRIIDAGVIVARAIEHHSATLKGFVPGEEATTEISRDHTRLHDREVEQVPVQHEEPG